MAKEDACNALPHNEQGNAEEESDDFENCKGRCGYTIWCRECMASRERQMSEAEQGKDNGEE